MQHLFARLLGATILATILIGCGSSGGFSPRPSNPGSGGPDGDENASAPVEDRNEATASLLASAEAATLDNRPGTAIVYLERAVRIEPRNADLWLRLGSAHLTADNTHAAEQHCRKAIALAANDRGLTRRAWLLLADIRDAQGQSNEAAAIRRQYGAITG